MAENELVKVRIEDSIGIVTVDNPPVNALNSSVLEQLDKVIDDVSDNKEIVGIVEVIKEAFPDKSDKTQKFVSVIVQAQYPLKREVRLQEIKKNKDFRDFALVKQSRLSVMRVDLKYWKKICKMGKV